MNNSENAFWQLLRSGLWCQPPQLAPLSPAEWEGVLQLSLRTGTAGLVADALESLPPAGMPPQQVLVGFVEQRAKLIRKHLRHNSTIHALMALLRGLGAEPILLKGQGNAQQYEHPTSRGCGDIDVYIGPERIDSLLQQLQQRGITCEEEINDNEKHANFYFQDQCVELHRYSALMDTWRGNRAYQQWWADAVGQCERLYATADGRMLSHPEEGAQEVLLAAPDRNAFFLFYHAFHHLTSMGVQFRQFCDVARYLHTHRGRIDLESLRLQLERQQLMRPFQEVGAYLHQYLGLDPECIPFFDPEASSRVIYRRLRRKCLNPKPPLVKRPEGRLGSKLYSLEQHIEVFFDTLPHYPRLACRQLVMRISMGIPNFFNRANRSGTLDHYLDRTK